MIKQYDETVLHQKPSKPIINPTQNAKEALKYYQSNKKLVKEIQDGYKTEYKSKFLDWTLSVDKLKSEIPAGIRSEILQLDHFGNPKKPTNIRKSTQPVLAKRKPTKIDNTRDYIKAQSIYELVNQIPAAGRTTFDLNHQSLQPSFLKQEEPF